ncbi:phosphoribulokinase/uridine kinase [Diaporthe helianthi]|uniref:Phosphoribulokinase/uridine kinase n=1 Tax=Diaporthe helianthi TaxID=158607 RepID=A0A2P5IFR7_DIAHE|nr:phosphoribulokinase/uridine kinase [Diaporthe helianthi]
MPGRIGPYQYLADMVIMYHQNSARNYGDDKQQKRRCLVALAGGLGSGKTTIAGHVRDRVEEQGYRCQVINVEGFLRPRAELSEAQLKQRGSIDTMDGEAVLHMVEELRDSRAGEDVSLPGFDEHTRETVPNGQVIRPETQVVIIEGTYVLANAQPWRKIGALVDQRWFVFVMPDVARERGARNYLDKGIVGSEEEALKRYDEIGVYTNKYVNKHSCRVDVVVENNDETVPLTE